MFTGIITDIGEVISVEKRGDTRFLIATSYDPASIALGASIDAVALTHSHPDHVGAAEFVRKTYGVPLWAHAAVAVQAGLWPQ